VHSDNIWPVAVVLEPGAIAFHRDWSAMKNRLEPRAYVRYQLAQVAARNGALESEQKSSPAAKGRSDFPVVLGRSLRSDHD
jgi:hypothetical protein